MKTEFYEGYVKRYNSELNDEEEEAALVNHKEELMRRIEMQIQLMKKSEDGKVEVTVKKLGPSTVNKDVGSWS